jgi:hypothetical protein
MALCHVVWLWACCGLYKLLEYCDKLQTSCGDAASRCLVVNLLTMMILHEAVWYESAIYEDCFARLGDNELVECDLLYEAAW